MPTPKSRRNIVLQSSYSPSNLVADLSLGMNASFTSLSTVTTVNVTEDSSVTGEESTEYSMTFALATAAIGSITLSFAASDEDLASGITVDKTRASTSTTPTATSGTVTPIPSPNHYYERIWQQSVFNGATELLEQNGALEVRVKAESGFTVTQTVTSTAVAELVLTYAWKDVNGVSQVSGTVKLSASSEAYGSYTLGTATVTDDPPSLGAKESAGPRKTLKQRLKELLKELRKRRREDRRDH